MPHYPNEDVSTEKKLITGKMTVSNGEIDLYASDIPQTSGPLDIGKKSNEFISITNDKGILKISDNYLHSTIPLHSKQINKSFMEINPVYGLLLTKDSKPKIGLNDSGEIEFYSDYVDPNAIPGIDTVVGKHSINIRNNKNILQFLSVFKPDNYDPNDTKPLPDDYTRSFMELNPYGLLLNRDSKPTIGIGSGNIEFYSNYEDPDDKTRFNGVVGKRSVIINNYKNILQFSSVFKPDNYDPNGIMMLPVDYTRRFMEIDSTKNNLFLNGNLGIGTNNPMCELDVKATCIKLGLEKNGGGQLRLLNNKDDNSIYLESFNSTGDGSAKELVLCGNYGNNVPTLRMKADTTIIDGNGELTVGCNGVAGKVLVNDQNGKDTVRINGGDSSIAVGGYDVPGEIKIFDKSDLNRPRASIGCGSISIGSFLSYKGLYYCGQVLEIGESRLSGSTNDHKLQLGKYTELNGDESMMIFRKPDQDAKVTVTIDGKAGDVILSNADCAEDFEISSMEQVDPGTVMVINDDGKLLQSSQQYDKRVAGVISGAGDLKPGLILGRQPGNTDRVPLALMGRVNCKVDAEYGRVEVGDLLTTSKTLGHAMKASNRKRSFGAVIGKALKPLKDGQDLIPILVALQ